MADKTMAVVVTLIGLIVGGCIPMIQPWPVNTLTYEFDKDKQQWTKNRCITSTQLGEDAHSVETVCRKEVIAAPPIYIERRISE